MSGPKRFSASAENPLERIARTLLQLNPPPGGLDTRWSIVLPKSQDGIYFLLLHVRPNSAGPVFDPPYG